MATKRTSSKTEQPAQPLAASADAELAGEHLESLQHTVIQALEKVKAGAIRVFDTSELSALFERVVIASGNSNRQTKALASSVRDAVREAGLPKPRIEGEENGEWIIVDCGQVVVHIMQPAIRQYYQLEDLWGEKPIEFLAKTTPKATTKKSATKKIPLKNVNIESADSSGSSVTKAAVKRAAPKKAETKKSVGDKAVADDAKPVRKRTLKSNSASKA